MLKTFAPLLEKSQLKLVLIKYKNMSAEDQYNCTAKRVIWGKESSINHVPL